MQATTCPNCYYSVLEKYCASCGQPALHHYDPGLHDVVHDAVHEFFHIDGKIFTTLKLLLFHPGRLTLNFLSGRRARFVNPLRLYLTLSVIYFLLGAAFDAKTNYNIDLKSGTGVILDREIAKSAQENSLTSTLLRLPQMKNLGTRIEKHPDELVKLFRKGFPKAVFILVPVFAFLLQLSYGMKRKYPQYLYFSLHYHAAFFGILILGMLVSPVLDLDLLPPIWATVYLAMALKKVWGGSSRSAALRTAAVGAVYLVFFLTALLGVMLYAVYNLSPA